MQLAFQLRFSSPKQFWLRNHQMMVELAMLNEKLLPIATFYRVRLMLVQMVMVVFATLLMLLASLPVSSAVLTALYGTIIWKERRLNIVSPISYALFATSLVIFLTHMLFDVSEYDAYVSMCFFGVLFSVGGTLLLLKRPATIYYGGTYGSIDLHWRTSILWVVVYAAGIAVSMMLLHYPGLYWVMPLVPTTGILITLWFQFVDMGKAWRRAKSFTLEPYRFDQLASTEEILKPFYEHFVREALPAIRQGIGPKHSSYEDLVALKMEADKSSWNRTLFFAAYLNEEIVGTISCALKSSENILGFETAHSEPLSLNRLQVYGKVMEVGRFSISPNHRFGQDVIQGLLRCAVEYAFENDAAFLVSQSFLNATHIYHKIGFRKIAEKTAHQTVMGVEIFLMVFNLARRVVCEPNDVNITNRLAGVLSPYRGERYFKRLSLRSLFFSKQPWMLSDADVEKLIADCTPIYSLNMKAQTNVS